MKKPKILEVIALYQNFFKRHGTVAEDYPHDKLVDNRSSAVGHCYGMLPKMETFLNEGRMGKVFRWLGFIQGVLWAHKFYTLDDLMNHSRPEPGEDSDSDAPGRIKIVKVPDGEAPLAVRRAWVGLVLPCHPFMGWPDEGKDRGVISGKEATRNRRGFSVPQDVAIEFLAKKDPDAAKWWREKGFPVKGEFFGFGVDEAEILEGVTERKIVWVGEDMQGQPTR